MTKWLVQVGFNRGDNNISYMHPLSLHEAIQEIDEISNVNRSGRWVYRVDGLTVRHPGACDENSLPSGDNQI